MRILFIGIGVLIALGITFMAWALVKVGAESDRRSEEFYRAHMAYKPDPRDREL